MKNIDRRIHIKTLILLWIARDYFANSSRGRRRQKRRRCLDNDYDLFRCATERKSRERRIATVERKLRALS